MSYILSGISAPLSFHLLWKPLYFQTILLTVICWFICSTHTEKSDTDLLWYHTSPTGNIEKSLPYQYLALYFFFNTYHWAHKHAFTIIVSPIFPSQNHPIFLFYSAQILKRLVSTSSPSIHLKDRVKNSD